MTKAFVSILKYDYGVKSRGYSYEYYNIYLPLCDILGKENVVLFDFYTEYKSSGKQGMNKKLREIVVSGKPDFALFSLFENEFDVEVVSSLRDHSKTISYFMDDPWRVDFARR